MLLDGVLGIHFGQAHVLTTSIGEGHFDDGSQKPSGAATPVGDSAGGPKGKKQRKTGPSGKKAKTAKQRLAMADGDVDMG